MSLPKEIQKILQIKREKIEKNDYCGWGYWVYQLKKTILVYQDKLTQKEWDELEREINLHQLQLEKKYNFFKKYTSLLYH